MVSSLLTSMGHRPTFFVAVDVLVIRDGKLLLGKRKGAYGAGFWGLPGGHLEEKESILRAGAREVKEETSLDAGPLVFSSVFNNNEREEHYVHVTLVARESKGEPVIAEPDKCEEWRWFPLDALPYDQIQWVYVPQIKAFLQNIHFVDTEISL